MMSSQITRQSNYNSTPYCLDKVNALRLGLTCSCCCLRPMHIYTLYLPLVLYRYEGPSCSSRLPGACSIIVYNVQMRTFSSFPSLVGNATKHSSSTVAEPTDAPRVHRDVALTQHLHLKRKKKKTHWFTFYVLVDLNEFKIHLPHDFSTTVVRGTMRTLDQRVVASNNMLYLVFPLSVFCMQ